LSVREQAVTDMSPRPFHPVTEPSISPMKTEPLATLALTSPLSVPTVTAPSPERRFTVAERGTVISTASDAGDQFCHVQRT
jgi:hypothetical protein